MDRGRTVPLLSEISHNQNSSIFSSEEYLKNPRKLERHLVLLCNKAKPSQQGNLEPESVLGFRRVKGGSDQLLGARLV